MQEVLQGGPSGSIPVWQDAGRSVKAAEPGSKVGTAFWPL